MPELPEVETTCRGLSPHIVGKSVKEFKIHNGKLRWPVPPQLKNLLKNKILLNLSRRGKYLLFKFEHGTLLWHLGMSGSIRIIKDNTPREKHDHIEVIFGNDCILRYNDPRRFGAAVWTEKTPEEHTLIAHLGPEPLTKEFSSEYLFEKSRKKTQKVKSWVMDGKLVVGVGNIYANESLFKARINPNKPAGKLTKKNCDNLIKEIKTILKKAIQQGGTTLKDFVGGDGKPGYFAQQLNVYGREEQPCPACAKKITQKIIAQRSTFYCTQCQK